MCHDTIIRHPDGDSATMRPDVGVTRIAGKAAQA
jgi:hypothetical protein